MKKALDQAQQAAKAKTSPSAKASPSPSPPGNWALLMGREGP